MKRVFFLLILAASAAGQASSTPYAAKWRREVLLGANDSVFATLVYSWDWPGSHYRSSDTVSVVLRQNETGLLFRQDRLWITTRQTDVDTNVHTVKRDSLGSFELARYFEMYQLAPVPAEGQLDMRWDIDSTGIRFVAADSIRETILSLTELLAKHPELTGSKSSGLPKITGVYSWEKRAAPGSRSRKYYYVLISSGSSDSPESDCYEEIILLHDDEVRAAGKRVDDRLHPNWRRLIVRSAFEWMSGTTKKGCANSFRNELMDGVEYRLLVSKRVDHKSGRAFLPPYPVSSK